MRFSINRELLIENLNVIQRGLPSKTTMPVFNGIKMDVEADRLILTSSSSDISIKTEILDESLTVIEEGHVVVSGKLFIDIIRKINANKVEICLIEDTLLSISTDRSEFKLKTFEYLDYPEINFISTEEPLLLGSSYLRQIVKDVNHAASMSEKRPILTGVNIRCENNRITAIATDSYRLNRKILNLENSTPDFNIVVPSSSLDDLYKVIEEYDGELQIHTSSNKILFAFNNVLFQTRLLEGNYPDTSRIIPTSFAVVVKFNKADLMDSLDRIALLNASSSKDYNYNLVNFKLRPDKIVELTAFNQSVGDCMEEIVPTDVVDGSILKLAISIRYLQESLRSFTSSELTFHFTGETKPFIITGDKDENLINLILPIRYE